MKNSPKCPKPPSNLSKPGKKLWKSLQAEYDIIDVAGLNYLTTGCRHFDRMEQARIAIAAEGPVIVDRFDQKKPHPSVLIERDSSASMLKCFRALNFDIEPLRDKPGRPAGR